MARSTPRVAGATLFDPADAAQAITMEKRRTVYHFYECCWEIV